MDEENRTIPGQESMHTRSSMRSRDVSISERNLTPRWEFDGVRVLDKVGCPLSHGILR